MTPAEMHLAFKLGYDKLDSAGYPDILPSEIDFLLNKAQDRFVKQRYGPSNNKKQSFEETQKRTDDIKALVKNADIVPLANTIDNIDANAQFAILPTDYWFTVQERASITYTGCHNTPVTAIVKVEVARHDDFNIIISNPFEKPDNETVLRLMSYDRAELVHAPGTVLNTYYLRYIKEPVRISLSPSVSCELSEHTHEEIVTEAISIALETIEAMRTRTFDPIIKDKQE